MSVLYVLCVICEGVFVGCKRAAGVTRGLFCLTGEGKEEGEAANNTANSVSQQTAPQLCAVEWWWLCVLGSALEPLPVVAACLCLVKPLDPWLTGTPTQPSALWLLLYAVCLCAPLSGSEPC